MYNGEYNGKPKHEADLDQVLERAVKNGLERIIITAGDLETLEKSLAVIKKYKGEGKYETVLYTTVGVHPTEATAFESDSRGLLDKLISLAESNKEHIVAVGEFGLDYDRLQFAPKETQLKYFEAQFELAEKLKLPLFLHMREAAADFIEIIKRNRTRFSTGVVHSFTGTAEEAKQILELDLYIGINGCSLKTQENLDVVKTIPQDKIMIETDAPWCEVRPTHAGAKFTKTTFPSVKREKWSASHCVKGRNEPCYIVNVLEIIAALQEADVKELSETIFKTTADVFFPNSTWL